MKRKKILGWIIIGALAVCVLVVPPVILFKVWWQFVIFYGVLILSIGGSFLMQLAIKWIDE